MAHWSRHAAYCPVKKAVDATPDMCGCGADEEPEQGGLGYPNDWEDPCPNCGARFPVLHGPHPTWVACSPPEDEGWEVVGYTDDKGFG